MAHQNISISAHQNIVLFDDADIRQHLLPLTFTRPVAELRCGIWTITEKWTHWLGSQPSFLTEPYLQKKYASYFQNDNIFINGAVCPNKKMVEAIQNLDMNEALIAENTILAYRASKPSENPLIEFKNVIFDGKFTILQNLWDIYTANDHEISVDFQEITTKKTNFGISDPNTMVYAPENIFVEEGAKIRAAILNAENGPIYIGKNASISEGSVVIGPCALCEDSTINWGAKIRSNTTIGPHCKVGGEVSNTILMGYSNKGHDGFLGNAVIGEWCNLGANTNNSNLKNDYTPVKIYNYFTQQLESTGQLFCGLFMADYTKAGISTMFNTGTVVGVCANVFGAGFQDKHIESFSWGGAAEGYTAYRFDKAVEVIRQTVARRGKTFDEDDVAILKYVQELHL